MTAELKISWGDDADGRNVAVRVDVIKNASVYILVPEGCFALNHEGTKIIEGEKLILNPGYIYYLTGFSNCWVVRQRVSFNV
jgi:hypothetical protein